MKIIKQGDAEIIAKLHKEFTCRRCGCVFKAEARECDVNTVIINARVTERWFVGCPDCGDMCSQEVRYD